MYDPTSDYQHHKIEYDSAIQNVLNHGNFILGPEIEKLETQLASYVGAKYCITVSSGTLALMIALMALDIGNGDEVITTAFTWISTAEVIAILGAIPVFVDIDPTNYLLDIDQIRSRITAKTKAIIPVSLYGMMPDMDKLNQLGEKYGIPIIEDAAQSFGSIFRGHHSCSCHWQMNRISCTSFFPSKPLGCYGDGGACFTNDGELAMRLKAIRNHGGIRRFEHNFIGTNARFDTLQGAILLIKLKYFDENLVYRLHNVELYHRGLQHLKNHIILPKIPADENKSKSVFAQYTIRLSNREIRDALRKYLDDNQIDTGIFYQVPLHLQNIFITKYGTAKGDLPITEQIADEVLSLPCYPDLREIDIKNIIRVVCDFFQSNQF